MRLALFQPDIPQNTGTLLRLAACTGLAVDIIEPCGFILDDKRLRRAGMDYLEGVDMTRHISWQRFLEEPRGRIVLLTTKADTPYTEFDFAADDCLLVGRESAGVPPEVHERADAQLVVPMKAGFRSLNVAVCAAMVVGEALRQVALK
ncbi:tRNA (cytidine(34)-2'-O)-methyltransferase [Pelagibius sp. Alg239-R121]|uniref:tRNA (cytidine(34)-2'-O)-methyltransferase n=1 Tax=Pelagibius sp. Alg239-R121 TaxID=2993448 RepID=UPI0024A6140D|nr:tRNA (cytidine(34)-2'-O)-methyltransferase [Pelagibius sp. Alg239-R121]